MHPLLEHVSDGIATLDGDWGASLPRRFRTSARAALAELLPRPLQRSSPSATEEANRSQGS
jgi:hypothetical protein